MQAFTGLNLYLMRKRVTYSFGMTNYQDERPVLKLQCFHLVNFFGNYSVQYLALNRQTSSYHLANLPELFLLAVVVEQATQRRIWMSLKVYYLTHLRKSHPCRADANFTLLGFSGHLYSTVFLKSCCHVDQGQSKCIGCAL